MRIGIVSDIHCNAWALEQALRRMGRIDALLCAGDAISQTRFSDEVVKRLRQLGAQVVLGNHDLEYLTHAADKAVESGRADGELVQWLRGQPQRLEMKVAGKRLLMVHATPWSWDYVYPGSPQMNRFAEVEADFVLGGHTHTPFSGRIGRPLVVNPGSAGHGRFHPEGPILSCAVLDAALEEVQFFDFPGPSLA